jgi:hypothetical protein
MIGIKEVTDLTVGVGMRAPHKSITDHTDIQRLRHTCSLPNPRSRSLTTNAIVRRSFDRRRNVVDHNSVDSQATDAAGTMRPDGKITEGGASYAYRNANCKRMDGVLGGRRSRGAATSMDMAIMRNHLRALIFAFCGSHVLKFRRLEPI